MSNEVLISGEGYLLLRQDSREALGRLGVGSNPCFTDHNILTRLSQQLGRDVPEEYDEQTEYAGEFFRDNLATILGLELPVCVADVRVTLNKVNSRSRF